MKKIWTAMFVIFVSTFLLLTSVPAAPAAQAGPYYVGVFGGYVIPDDLEISGPFVEGGDVSLKNSWMLGAKFGYIPPTAKWFAAELEYYYLADQDVDEAGATGNFSASNLMVNAIFRWPDGKIHPYAGFGVGWSWGSLQASSDVGWVDESDNTIAWQFLAGVNFEIAPNWSAELGYRYFSCQYDVGFWDAEATNHIFSVGVNYHF